MNTLRTPAEAKAWLLGEGISIRAFADGHGLDRATTYQVLSGAKIGRRGKAHAAAVALGITDRHKGSLMDDLNEVTADALEMIMLNQNALGAAIEELSHWVRGQGGIETHANIVGALETLDTSNEGIASMIRVLRR
jgi:gp16 family phage-associated protein